MVMMKAKRNATIVISSSDDDEDLLVKSNFSQPKPKPKLKAASVPRKNPKRAKTASFSASCPRSSKVASGFDEMKRFCEEFDDDFIGIKVSAVIHGCQKTKLDETQSGLQSNNDLWVDKHKPHFLEELAVHKKKVEEVKIWFEERLKAAMMVGTAGGLNLIERKMKTWLESEITPLASGTKMPTTKDESHVLLVAGPSGVGKTATIHAIALHLGATIWEWNTPTPTVWAEHLHNANSGLQYMSKLNEFEGFVERVRKYGLPSPTLKGSQTSVILLVDDLPVVHDRGEFRRLQKCLKLLVQLMHIPTAIVVTNYDKDDSADFSMRCSEELLISLHNTGARKVNFNPVTVSSIKKALTAICRKEQHDISADLIELVAKASGGDIRHAITSLQYLCLNPLRKPVFPSKGRLDDGFCLPFGKDETLSLFHALGKFLHNKRETEHTTASDRDAFLLKEKFVRFPLKMDAPEVVLSQAHGQARTLSDFLHENVLDFMSEEAIDDAWLVASYLSDADFLQSSLNGLLTRDFGAENVIQSAAASVAARGVLFGNAYPVSSRWHAVRRPKLWEVEQSLRRNKGQMLRQRDDLCNSRTFLDKIVMATEFRPALEWLGYRAFQTDQLSDDSDGTSLHENKQDMWDDEIEDW